MVPLNNNILYIVVLYKNGDVCIFEMAHYISSIDNCFMKLIKKLNINNIITDDLIEYK